MKNIKINKGVEPLQNNEEISKFIENLTENSETFNKDEISKAIVEITGDENMVKKLFKTIEKERNILAASKDKIISTYSNLSEKEKNIVKTTGAIGIATIVTGTAVMIKKISNKGK